MVLVSLLLMISIRGTSGISQDWIFMMRQIARKNNKKLSFMDLKDMKKKNLARESRDEKCNRGTTVKMVWAPYN